MPAIRIVSAYSNNDPIMLTCAIKVERKNKNKFVNLLNCWVWQQVSFARDYWQGGSLGLDVSASRRSRDLFFQCLGLVSISGKCGTVLVSISSRTRASWKPNVSVSSRVSGLKVSFTMRIFLSFFRINRYIIVLYFIINTCFVSHLNEEQLNLRCVTT